MDCNRIPSGIQWEILSPNQLSECQAHLRSCAICRKRVFSQTPELLLFNLQQPELPEDFWLGFWPSLEKKLEPEERTAKSYLFPVLRWAAVFVIILILTLYNREIQEPGEEFSTVSPKQLPDSFAYPLIEEVQNPNARYYIFQPEGNENFVMVFDRSPVRNLR